MQKSKTALCKVLHKQILAKWGLGWRLLGDDLKRTVIAERVLLAFAARDEDSSVTPAAITELFEAMKNYMGLDED
jgi:hypothetical protein